MRKLFMFASLVAAIVFIPTAALARVVAKVDLSTQRMTVSKNGVVLNKWKISSGARGYITPNGTFKAQRIYKDYESKEYEGAKMYHTVFFNSRGHAIHGTKSTWRLGSPASHGCIRLSRGNAKQFHDLVKRTGKRNVTIKIVGKTRLRKKRRVAKKKYYKRSNFSWNKRKTIRRKTIRRKARKAKRNKRRYRRTSSRRSSRRNAYNHFTWF